MLNINNKVLRNLVFSLLTGFTVVVALSSHSHAQVKDYSFENMEVVFDVNKDSTMDVSEKVTYKFNGEFSILERTIPLQDYENTQRCKSDATLQCGGFDALKITGSKYNGKEVPVEDMDIWISDDYYERTQHIEYNFGTTDFENDSVVWEINYTIYGGLGFFPDEEYDLFYWNALPPNRTKDFPKASVQVNFPSNLELTKEDISVYGFSGYYDYEFSPNGVKFSVEDMLSYNDFTVLVKFPEGIVDKPANISLNLNPATQNVKYFDVEREVKDGEAIFGLPAGDYKIEFSASGYNSKEVSVNLEPGEEETLEVKLERNFFVSMIDYFFIAISLLACPLSLFSGLYIFMRWYAKGRDVGGRKTIVPWFVPPDNIPPYLLGSLKDEKVDPVDITSTLVDTAYRGFIKIIELEKKKYKFKKLKDFGELDSVEKKILDDIFGDNADKNDEVTTDELKNKFFTKIKGINDAVYDEMVEKGYFEKRPDKTRDSNIGCAIGLIVLGVFEHNVTINMMNIVKKELQLYGSWTCVFSFEETMLLMKSQKLDANQLITNRYSFQDSIKAFQEAASDKGNRIKSVIEFPA